MHRLIALPLPIVSVLFIECLAQNQNIVVVVDDDDDDVRRLVEIRRTFSRFSPNN